MKVLKIYFDDKDENQNAAMNQAHQAASNEGFVAVIEDCPEQEQVDQAHEAIKIEEASPDEIREATEKVTAAAVEIERPVPGSSDRQDVPEPIADQQEGNAQIQSRG